MTIVISVRCSNPDCNSVISLPDYIRRGFILSWRFPGTLVYTSLTDPRKNNAMCPNCGRVFIRYEDYLKIVESNTPLEFDYSRKGMRVIKRKKRH